MEKEEAAKEKNLTHAELLQEALSLENERLQFEGTLDKLILNTTFNKYDIILLARRWAYELKSKEGETRTLQELIAVSIQDILSSRVNHKMVRDLPHLTFKKQKSLAATVLGSLGTSKGGKA